MALHCLNNLLESRQSLLGSLNFLWNLGSDDPLLVWLKLESPLGKESAYGVDQLIGAFKIA